MKLLFDVETAVPTRAKPECPARPRKKPIEKKPRSRTAALPSEARGQRGHKKSALPKVPARQIKTAARISVVAA